MIAAERRALQFAVGLACMVPFYAGGLGAFAGPEFLRGVNPPVAVDLDSHFRYLSGLLMAVGLGFAACIPTIERRSITFRLLTLIVLLGGLARLLTVFENGWPSFGHRFGLVMELGVVPSLALWQSSLARRWTAQTPRQ